MSSIMEDQMDAWASASSYRNRHHLKLSGCVGIFSQLFDWNRVLGSKSFGARLLVPDVTSSQAQRDVEMSKPEILNPCKPKSSRMDQKTRRQKEHERRESIEFSLTQLIGLNDISSRVDNETPMELRQLLHVEQEPFVLEDLLKEKRQPTRRRDAEMNVRACMKAGQNVETKRCQKSKRSKVSERKYEADGEKASTVLKQKKSPAPRTIRVPAESIVTTPSSQVRGQFAETAFLSPAKASSKVASPGRSPVKSPNKKALLMETAAKILEGSSRSRKPLPSKRPLLLEMDTKHALFESNPSKKTSKSMSMQMASSERQDRSVTKIVAETKLERAANSNCLENERVLNSKQNCEGLERAGIGLGKSDFKLCGQRLDNDFNSQGRAFRCGSVHSSAEMVADLACSSPLVRGTNAISQSNVHERRKERDAVDTQNSITKDSGDVALLRSFLRRKAIATNSSAGRMSRRTGSGRRIAEALTVDVTGASPNSGNVASQHSEQDAFEGRRLHSGLRTHDVESPKHDNEGIAPGCFDSNQTSEDSSFAFSPSFPLVAEANFSKMNRHVNPLTDDNKICERVETDNSNGLGDEEKSYSFDRGEVFVAHERSPRCGQTLEREDLQCILSEGDSPDIDRRLIARAQKYESALPASGEREDGDSNEFHSQAKLTESAQVAQILVMKATRSMLKLCDFSWWERDMHSEEEQRAEQGHLESADQSTNDSEEEASNDSLESPPVLLRIFGEDTGGMSLEGEVPIALDLDCTDERQFSPVSVLDAAFEEDFPILDESLASFQEARKLLLDNVRRYELLSQMDLETLMKYTEIDSSVEEEEESSISSIQKVWDGDTCDVSINSNQQQQSSPFLDYSWNVGGENDTGGDKEEPVLNHGDESSVCLVEETGPSLGSDQFETEVSREVEGEDIESSECDTANLSFLERLQKGGRLRCKLFFDCVTEASEPIVPRKSSNITIADAWSKVPANLLQELQDTSFPLELSTAACLAEIDIKCKKSGWIDSRNWKEDIGADIESSIFGLLVSELLTELICETNSSEFNLQRPQLQQAEFCCVTP